MIMSASSEPLANSTILYYLPLPEEPNTFSFKLLNMNLFSVTSIAQISAAYSQVVNKSSKFYVQGGTETMNQIFN